MSMRDYRDMESLKAHAGKLEAENGMYKQQLMESHQSHLDSVARYNHLKNEMDQLRECYRSLTEDSHKMKMMYESQCEELNKDKAESQTLRAQCTAVTQKWQSVTQNWQLLSNENQELEKMNKAMKLENEKLSNELVNLRSMKDHDYALLCREKDELAKNHHLVMSERDGVHKEIDMLNDRIAKADSKVSQLEHERKQMNDKVVTYKQELQAALRDRDQAQKHIADILNDSSLDHSRLRMALENRLLDTSRPDRNEVNEEQPRPLVPSYDTKESPPDVHSSKEVENLLKEISLLQQELKERDKIVQERESIRRQCDELRRERDRAVSNHAEELRTLDDLKKFKAVTTRELTEMREKLDKEERRNHLTAGSNSRDSAIDNDYQDWDTETLEYDIELSNNMYHMDLGIDLSCSGGDLSDPVLYVNSIAKGSPCDGKLRVNDVLLRVNNVDMTSASKERALDAIKSSPSSVVNLKVRRKKAIGRFNIPVAFRLNKKDLGLQLESGVYISKISPGSYLAKEGNVAVGDRVLLVNNKSVEHKTAKEVMKMIEGSGDYIVLHVGKYGVMPADNNSPPSINGSNSLIEKVKNKFRNSDKNLSSKQHQPNVSADTGTGTTSKRHKSSTGGRHGIFSLFKTTSSSDDKDESDTIKVKTDHVMSILEKMHRGAGDVDMGSLSSAPCSDGVPAIPNSIVDHDKIYSTKPQRHNSGDPIDSKMDRQVRTPSYYPSTSYSPQSPLDRISVTSSTLFDATLLYMSLKCKRCQTKMGRYGCMCLKIRNQILWKVTLVAGETTPIRCIPRMQKCDHLT
ncbi:hypothetical protein EB796_019542 [Bugula neritina]|uniref:PDZ domain-containing protein n=1 Tax=Bugula neritina TaxID=10212 RepID=A0A7J7J7G1_BUGNE|nr:hypothetical protein EB796_019542 [Bugula neritina]